MSIKVKPKTKQSGFSLVEMMIAMTLSTLVIGGLVSYFSSTVGSTGVTTGNIQFNQDFQTAMSFISDEIRSTGYWNSAISSDVTANPFGLSYPNNSTARTCIQYSYDVDSDGNLDNNEKRAIRLNSEAIEYIDKSLDGTLNNSICADSSWNNAVQLTDKNKMQVTDLKFTLSEKCYNSSQNTEYTCSTSQSSGDLLLTIQKISIDISGQLKANTNIKRHIEREITLRNTVTTKQ